MKILIIHTAFIGDIVLSIPLIKKINHVYPKAEITYLTTPAGAAILKNNPFLDEIIVYDKKVENKGIKGILEIADKLKKQNFEAAYIPHRYLRSSMIAFLGKIKLRIGYKGSGGSFFLNKKIEYKKGVHEVERLLNLIDGDNNFDTRIELFPSEKEVENIEKLWDKENLNNKKVIVIAPGSKWFTKMWPIEYFNKLIKMIESQDRKVVVIGGKEEIGLNIINGENIINLLGKTTLLELYEILRRSDIVVTNDSSPIHIASATKTFIVAIFGATVKEFGFYPWSKNSIIIENNNIDCRPCGLHGGKKCPRDHFKCMKDIQPEHVAKIIDKKLERVISEEEKC